MVHTMNRIITRYESK